MAAYRLTFINHCCNNLNLLSFRFYHVKIVEFWVRLYKDGKICLQTYLTMLLGKDKGDREIIYLKKTQNKK